MHFANEADASWLAFLDIDQAAIADSILAAVQQRGPKQRQGDFTLIVGGPGTGKTSILLNLASRLIELNLIPELVISHELAEFIKSSGFNPEALLSTLAQAELRPHGDVLLIDDPSNKRMIERASWLAKKGHYRAIVIALDPFQLEDDVTDSQFASLSAGSETHLFVLSSCYRQKEVVGLATKKAFDSIARSSPFLSIDKKEAFWNDHQALVEVSNSLRFRNPSGRAKTYKKPTFQDIRSEVRRLLRAPSMWKHTPPFLLALDDEYEYDLPQAWQRELARLRNVVVVRMSEAARIKGTEFQHVILFLSSSLFTELQTGFEGASRRLYDLRRLYRIPLSRAKDSITVFVAPPKSAAE